MWFTNCDVCMFCNWVSPSATLRGNVEVTGVPTSVPVRVAYELHLAGHKYLDVRSVFIY